jgi:hypothetical protein
MNYIHFIQPLWNNISKVRNISLIRFEKKCKISVNSLADLKLTHYGIKMNSETAYYTGQLARFTITRIASTKLCLSKLQFTRVVNTYHVLGWPDQRN